MLKYGIIILLRKTKTWYNYPANKRGENIERLQKVIAEAGIASRRKAEDLITSGKVKVNGEIVTELGTKVSRKDRIEVNNKPIEKQQKRILFIK